MNNEIQPKPKSVATPTATGATPPAQANNGREGQWAEGLNEFDENLAQNSIGETKSKLPQVIIPGDATTITESAESLFKEIVPFKQLFYRGGVVVDLRQEGAEYEMEVLDAVTAQSRFEKYVQFVKANKKGQGCKHAIISEAIAKQYLKSDACRSLLPKLNGILHCPLIVEKKDGTLHRAGQGYDDVSGFFIAASKPVSKVNLEEAVQYMTKILEDFDFVTPGDRSRAIASLITPALKLGGFIKGPVPVDVAEADVSQSGKTYRQKLVAGLYNQKMAVVTKKGGGVGSMEETFNDHLIKGKAFIQFDNVRGKLDSHFLEAFITADGTFSARVPYCGSVAVDPSKFMLFISSNGFETTEDLANRASIIRIRKREHHQYQNYKGQDILQLTSSWQSLFVGALFTIVEEWHRQGKPKTNETQHDFKEWCQSLDWIVQNIFKEAPLMDGHAEAKQRAASPQMSFLRMVAVKLGPRQKLDQALSASEIASICMDENIDIPGLMPGTKADEQAPMQIGRILGSLFKDQPEVVLDDFKVVKSQERVTNDKGNHQTMNKYLFSHA